MELLLASLCDLRPVAVVRAVLCRRSSMHRRQPRCEATHVEAAPPSPRMRRAASRSRARSPLQASPVLAIRCPLAASGALGSRPDICNEASDLFLSAAVLSTAFCSSRTLYRWLLVIFDVVTAEQFPLALQCAGRRRERRREGLISRRNCLHAELAQYRGVRAV